MNIAYTFAQGRGDTDLLLCDVAIELQNAGYRVVGTVQINTDRPKSGPCDMDVQILPDGPTIRISQNLGVGAKGCRLDTSALSMAVGLVDVQLGHGADVLIINKFGKNEAEGRGFRETIATAVAAGIPVLVGANALNENALLDFTANTAQKLPPDKNSLVQWITALNNQAATAA